MQREALLTNAVMVLTQLIKEREKLSHITRVKFGCGGAALVYIIGNYGSADAVGGFDHHLANHRFGGITITL